MIWFISIFIFLSLLTGALAIRSLFFSEEQERSKALQQRLNLLRLEGDPREAALNSLLRDRSYSSIPFLDRMLATLPRLEEVRLLLHQAGNPCNVGTLILMVCTLAMLGAFTGIWRGSWPLGVALSLAGMAAPIIWLRVMRKRRLAAFDEQFPEAVDLMARALRAGHSFNSTMQVVSEEMDDPLAGEFTRTFEDYSYGKTLEDALEGLVRRVNLQDVKFFTTAVIMQKETGGNLTEILDNISYIIRERFSLMREVRALSAEGRLSGVILTMLPPMMLVVLMVTSPGYLDFLLNHPMGENLLIAGGVFQVLGMLTIRRLVNLEV